MAPATQIAGGGELARFSLSGKFKKRPSYIAGTRGFQNLHIMLRARGFPFPESALGAFCMCVQRWSCETRPESELASCFFISWWCVAASVCNIFPQRAAPHAICERASRLHFLINRDAVTHSQSIACRWNSQRDAQPDLKSPQKGHSPNCWYVCDVFDMQMKLARKR